MRRAFISALSEIAERDERVLLLSGDLGYTVVEPFADAYPRRFFNVGVAEQNMIGLATGLAEAGFIPFVYTIATFAVLRPYEFIRNGPVLQRRQVRIVGVGGGFEYGAAGPSHHALEDLAVTRVQPELTVIAPADHVQAGCAIRATYDLPGPIYYRLGKDDRTTVPGLEGRFTLGRAELVREGDDALFVTTGSITVEAAAAADDLATQGVHAGVLVVASLRPAPLDDLVRALVRRAVVVTVEEHYVDGGLGSLVAELIAERGLPCRLVRCGVRRGDHGITGSERYLRDAHGLSRQALVVTTLAAAGAPVR